MSCHLCQGKGGSLQEETYLGCARCNCSGYIMSCTTCLGGSSGPGCPSCRDDPGGIKCSDCNGSGHKKPAMVWRKCWMCSRN